MKKTFLLIPLVLLIVVGCTSKPNFLDRLLNNIKEDQVVTMGFVTNANGTISVQTNRVIAYTMTAKPEVVEIVKVGGTAIGDFFGVGGIVGIGLSAALAAWVRSRNKKVNGQLVQDVQLSREVVASVGGEAVAERLKDKLILEQKKSGTKVAIEKILEDHRDEESAVADAKVVVSPG